MVLASRGQRAELRLAGGVALSREALDAALVTAAAAEGASFLPETLAAVEKIEADKRQVMLQRGEQSIVVNARVVLAADGLASQLLRGHDNGRAPVEHGSWIGAGVVADAAPHLFFQPRAVFMACGHGGYVGLVRLEDGRLNIAAAFDPAAVRRSHHPGRVASGILEDAGFPVVPGLCDLPWRGTPPLTRRVSAPAMHRLFLIGDAAGYVEPFTGEGIAWALAAGMAVSELAVRGACQWDRALETEWARVYNRIVLDRQKICTASMKMLKHPGLTAAVVALLSRLPQLATPVLRRLHQSASSGRGVQP
jgi:flavin-dependent dehydrogenase